VDKERLLYSQPLHLKVAVEVQLMLPHMLEQMVDPVAVELMEVLGELAIEVMEPINLQQLQYQHKEIREELDILHHHMEVVEVVEQVVLEKIHHQQLVDMVALVFNFPQHLEIQHQQ
jgi:hypothetical protein